MQGTIFTEFLEVRTKVHVDDMKYHVAAQEAVSVAVVAKKNENKLWCGGWEGCRELSVQIRPQWIPMYWT